MKKYYAYIEAAIHAIVLLIIFCIYINLSWSFGLENELIQKIGKVQKLFFKKGKDTTNNYLFINTGYSNTVIDVETKYGSPGNMVITDRDKLATLFNLLKSANNKHHYIICDVLFDYPSSNDKKLKEALQGLNNIIFPATIGQEEKPLIFDLNVGSVEYITYNGLAIKMEMFNEKQNIKSLPVKMYEDINQKILTKSNFLFFKNGNYYYSKSFFPIYNVLVEEMEKNEIGLNDLINILNINKDFYDKNLKNKILIIGNFENDKHVTMTGAMPGSLILYNTFLTIQQGKVGIHYLWFLFALIIFYCISYYYLCRPVVEKKSKYVIMKWVLKFLSLTSLLTLISLLSVLIINVHLSILPIVFYIEIVMNLKYFIKQKNKTYE